MKKNRMHFTGTHGRSGSTLVVVSLLLAAVAMLSLSFLTVLRSAQRENQGSRETLSALYACEAGLAAAMDDLKDGGTGALGAENQRVGLGGQSYWVERADLGSGRIALRSYGHDDRAGMGVEMVVQPASSGYFRWAAFGDENLHMDSNSRTDSYDSSVGDYPSQQVNGSGSSAYANADGDIGSNSDISMDSNVGVWGDASPGPGGTVTGNLADITGSTIPMPSSIALPAIAVPTIPSSGALTVSSSQTLSSGSHAFTSLQVNVGKTLTIVGPATIVCDDFKLRSNSDIVVDGTNGPVEFFIVNDFVLNSNTTIRSTTGSPRDVAFNLLSDNILDPGIDVNFDEDLVDFDSGSSLYGTIYAPSAVVAIDSNFELFGSLVARRVELNSNCRIHYDEQLATAGTGSSSTYQKLAWRVIPLP